MTTGPWEMPYWDHPPLPPTNVWECPYCYAENDDLDGNVCYSCGHDR